MRWTRKIDGHKIAGCKCEQSVMVYSFIQFNNALLYTCKLQLHSSESALCGSKGTLRNIQELICNEPVQFKLRLDHGLNEDVREWLTGPVNVL